MLKKFWEIKKGTMDEKLKTIQALVNKKLPITDVHLQSIHEVLHGEPLGDILAKIVKNIRSLSKDEGVEQSDLTTQHMQYLDSEETTPIKNMDVSDGGNFSIQWPYGNEDWFVTLPVQTKDVIVRTVNERLSEATEEFRQLQKDIGQKLENARFLLSNIQPQARQQGKMFIESAIYTLDRMILQGKCMAIC